MKCNEVRTLLDAFIDLELPENEVRAVMAHIDDCPECGFELNELEKLRACLRSLPHTPAPAALHDAVMKAIGEEATTKPSPDIWQWARPVMTHTAAAFAGGLILYGALLLPQKPHLPESEVLTAHVRSLNNEGLVQVAAGDPHKIKPWFAGRLSYSPIVVDLAAGGFPLQGGRVDHLGARKVAALVYVRREHKINLFIMPESQNDPEQPVTSSRSGFNISGWRGQGFQFWAISDLSAGELSAFSKAIHSAIE